jgi:hypothetical protein
LCTTQLSQGDQTVLDSGAEEDSVTEAGPPASLSFFRRVERWSQAIVGFQFVSFLLGS